MINYWIVFSVLAVHYVAFSAIWIDTYRTMKPAPKIIATSVCILILVLFSLGISYRVTGTYWRAILLYPISIGIWAAFVDICIGVIFHKNPFYLSPTTFPDKHILWFVHNGYLYTVTKAIWILVSSGLLRYFN